MADRTIGGEAGRDVARVCRLGEVLLMARIAGHRRVGVVAVGMALRARERGVHAGQRVPGIGGVIEAGSGPVDGGVADRAVLRKSRRDVRRVTRAVEFAAVTAVARRRNRGVVIVHMALAAGRGRVRAG